MISARLRSRIGTVLTGALVLSGCWQNPKPPSDNTTDAYGWRAPFQVEGAEPYYRIPVDASLSDWMKQHEAASVAVFDAAGALQQCGMLSGSMNAPMATASLPIGATVKPFDPNTCSNAPRPNICFKNHPCAVPDYCPFQEVDLTGTTLDGITNVDDIVAIGTAKSKPILCSPLSGDGYRACTDADRQAAEALQKLQTRQTEAMEFMINFGLSPDAGGQQELERIRTEAAAHREVLVTLDRKPESSLELVLHWHTTADLPNGYATLSCFSNGGSSETNIAFPAMTAGSDAQTREWPQCGSQSYRIRFPGTAPALELPSVAASEHAPKPFMRSNPSQYWFAAIGTPPYSLYLEKNRSGCGSSLNLAEVNKLPRAFDTEWPPAISHVATPQVHERDAWLVLRATRPDVAAWIYWLIYVGGSCVAAFAVLLVYWAWLASTGRTRYRSRK